MSKTKGSNSHVGKREEGEGKGREIRGGRERLLKKTKLHQLMGNMPARIKSRWIEK